MCMNLNLYDLWNVNLLILQIVRRLHGLNGSSRCSPWNRKWKAKRESNSRAYVLHFLKIGTLDS
jgi:hypothetical protein